MPPAPAAHPFGRLGETLAMVRFTHTLFAMPFAFIGMLLAARGLPHGGVVAWIVVAMVMARTAAMTFNRLVDRHLDAANPRTAGRSLPAGRLSPAYAWAVCLLAVAGLLVAAWQLNPLALALAPLALVILCGYSLTKRFTAFSHVALGLALAGAPLGAWIAVRGDIRPLPLVLSLAVLTWTAGFDIIYALQDETFDRRAGLHSLPVLLGPQRALLAARSFHGATIVLLAATGWLAELGPFYAAALATGAILLVWEHCLVSPADLSRMQTAFFRLNVALGLVMLAGTAADLLWT